MNNYYPSVNILTELMLIILGFSNKLIQVLHIFNIISYAPVHDPLAASTVSVVA